MLKLPNGNFYRNKPDDPTEKEGYTLDPDNPKMLIQTFLPCIHRVMRICSTCPRTKTKHTKPSCKLLNITNGLVCVGCSKRVAN